MPVLLQDIQNEFDAYIPGFSNGPDFVDMAAVALFLGNGTITPAFMQALGELEQALQDRIEARLTPSGWQVWKPQPNMQQAIQDASNYWTQRLNGGPKNQTFSHLLSEELTAMEAAHGFGFHNPNHQKAQYYVSVVTPADFRAQLRLGRHWKDPGVPGAHGEYTHRIQWYLVCRSGILPQGRPLELFQMMGFAGFPLNPPVNGANETDFWQLVCDRDRVNGNQAIAPKADSNMDFRCPEHFNEYLTTQLPVNQYPVLRSFLEARQQKRANYVPTDYVARKLFGQNYNALGQAQQGEVLRALDERDLYSLLMYNGGYNTLQPQNQQAVDNFFNQRNAPGGILRV